MDKAFLVFFALLILLLLILLGSNIQVRVTYTKLGPINQWALKFSLWRGLLRYHYELPVEKAKKNASLKDKPAWIGSLTALSNAINTCRVFGPCFLQLFKKARLRCFIWQTELGTGDPAQTGLLAGALWGVKGIAVTRLGRLFSSSQAVPLVKVWPSFDDACFKMSIDCTFEVRMGYFVFYLFKLMGLRNKRRRAGLVPKKAELS